MVRYLKSARLVLSGFLVMAASSEVSVPGPLGPLRGTLSGPGDNHHPAILILPGSGPTDRDGNNSHGVTAAPYRLLAAELDKSGITTVRIDKRGLFGSAEAVNDPNGVTIDDYVSDTTSWVNAIKERTGVKCVWLLGHSEGGLIALRTIEHQSAGICGLILVDTPSVSMGEILKRQLRANPANEPYLPAAFEAIDDLDNQKSVDTSRLPVPIQPLFPPAVQGFLRSIFQVKPREIIASCNLPTLILQSGLDLQVPAENGEELHSAQPGSKLVILKNTNHVLKVVDPEDPEDNLRSYTDPSRPISLQISLSIRQFISSYHI